MFNIFITFELFNIPSYVSSLQTFQLLQYMELQEKEFKIRGVKSFKVNCNVKDNTTGATKNITYFHYFSKIFKTNSLQNCFFAAFFQLSMLILKESSKHCLVFSYFSAILRNKLICCIKSY